MQPSVQGSRRIVCPTSPQRLGWPLGYAHGHTSGMRSPSPAGCPKQVCWVWKAGQCDRPPQGPFPEPAVLPLNGKPVFSSLYNTCLHPLFPQCLTPSKETPCEGMGALMIRSGTGSLRSRPVRGSCLPGAGPVLVIVKSPLWVLDMNPARAQTLFVCLQQETEAWGRK